MTSKAAKINQFFIWGLYVLQQGLLVIKSPKVTFLGCSNAIKPRLN
jgi:hypothetical protein